MLYLTYIRPTEIFLIRSWVASEKIDQTLANLGAYLWIKDGNLWTASAFSLYLGEFCEEYLSAKIRLSLWRQFLAGVGKYLLNQEYDKIQHFLLEDDIVDAQMGHSAAVALSNYAVQHDDYIFLDDNMMQRFCFISRNLQKFLFKMILENTSKAQNLQQSIQNSIQSPMALELKETDIQKISNEVIKAIKTGIKPMV